MYTVIYQKQAIKTLAKMPSAIAIKIEAAFNQLATGNSINLDIKPLEGMPYYRLRVGQWRAVYNINEGKLTIVVVKIGARGGVYK